MANDTLEIIKRLTIELDRATRELTRATREYQAALKEEASDSADAKKRAQLKKKLVKK